MGKGLFTINGTPKTSAASMAAVARKSTTIISGDGNFSILSLSAVVVFTPGLSGTGEYVSSKHVSNASFTSETVCKAYNTARPKSRGAAASFSADVKAGPALRNVALGKYVVIQLLVSSWHGAAAGGPSSPMLLLLALAPLLSRQDSGATNVTRWPRRSSSRARAVKGLMWLNSLMDTINTCFPPPPRFLPRLKNRCVPVVLPVVLPVELRLLLLELIRVSASHSIAVESSSFA